MWDGNEVAELLIELGVSHVVTVPDSTFGPWQSAIESSELELIRVCREGESWAVAGGLYLGGCRPLVMIQCTGFFESGDALRNILFDYKMPIYSIVGYRSYHNESTLPGDTAKLFTEPLVRAWGLDYRLIETPDDLGQLREHYTACMNEPRPGVALIAEGKA